MTRKQKPRVLVSLALGVILCVARPASLPADDRDLLRDKGSNPYLFIALDNSTSMNLKTGGDDAPAVGYGDDPASRIYQAKEALFEVLESDDGVNLGFTIFNQDQLSVRFQHYPYFHSAPLPGGWPLDWPRPETDGLIQLEDSNGDGVVDRFTSNINGDVLVFGEEFRDGAGNLVAGGTCGSPLDLDDAFERERANSFAKLGTFGTVPTEMWISAGPGKGKTYNVRVVRLSGTPGDSSLSVRLELRTFSRKCDDYSPTSSAVATVNLNLVLDPQMDAFLMTDLGTAGGMEDSPGYWQWSDALGAPVCGSGRPHSGLGWEGNYDGSFKTGAPNEDPVDSDIFCDPANGPRCVDLLNNPTAPDSRNRRELDRGDLLPFDWRTDNKMAVLQRLAPNYPDGAPDFRITPHLEPWVIEAHFGLYRPRLTGRPPVVAAGSSPIANAIVDFQCWYKGSAVVSTNIDCGATAFSPTGWSGLACEADSRYGCRKPYFLIITDGGDSCDGNNPRADINRMFRDAGVKTWVLNVGDPRNCTSGNLSTWIKSPGNPDGEGICVTASTKQEMVDLLRSILGEIQEEKAAFASAAVPSVQANVNQAIYLSSFVPFNEKAVWKGDLDAFNKPVRFDADGRPLVPQPNHLWNAAEVMTSEQYSSGTPVGFTSSQRRVFYSQVASSGQWPTKRQLLDTAPSDSDTVRYDLWRGLGLVGAGVSDGGLNTTQEDLLQARTELVLGRTVGLRSAARADGTLVEYLLGDIFHSDPVLIAGADNSKFFDLDFGADQDKPCNVDDSAANSNRGYRCFFLRNLFRRRILLAASNDGMLHAFNVGMYDAGAKEFDDGSGHEVWAYMPRLVMPTVRKLAEGQSHKYTVDGRVSAAAVFIDPLHNGTPDPDERLWRTLVVGGLREGGSGYYALDVTQPDKMVKVDPDPAAFGDERFLPTGAGSAMVPACSPPAASGCGPVPYPSVVWEFNDTTADSQLTGLAPAKPARLDEDGNGHEDLGDSWSDANIGAIEICKTGAGDCSDPSNSEMRFVAVFGGGMDPANKDFDPTDPLALMDNTLRGNWLYMLDVETGKVIYKRKLLGAAPGVTSIVDTDQDGLIERVYIGTLAGYMYRVDLTPVGGKLPQLSVTTALDLNGNVYDVERIPETSPAGPVWEPFVVFDANYDGTTRLDLPRNIFHRPSVLFVGELGEFALAFGTGDREDLWAGPRRSERFYVFVDDSDHVDRGSASAFPFRETHFERVELTDLNESAGISFLRGTPGSRGWFHSLGSEERVTSPSFSLSGITFFSSFTPRIELESPEGGSVEFDPESQCGSAAFEENTENSCSSSGSSSVFVVNSTNGNGLLPDGPGWDRYRAIDDVFVSTPFTEPTVTADPDPNAPPPADEPPKVPTDLYPENCKFASYSERISVVASDASLTNIADVPICIIEKNWKEF